MKIIRERIENGFAVFTKWVYEHPGLVLICTGVIMAFLIIQLSQLTFNVTLEGQFKKNDTTYKNYQNFKKQYGDDSAILVGIQSDKIFTKPFLDKLSDLHYELENEIPYLDEITSLVNVNYISAQEDELIVQDLLEDWPQTEADLKDLKKKILNYPAYQNMLISEDGTCTAIYLITEVNANLPGKVTEDKNQKAKKVNPVKAVLNFLTVQDKTENEKLIKDKLSLTNEQRAEIVSKIREITAKYNSDDFSIFLTGQPVILNDHLAQVERNLPRSILLTAIGIFILMLLIFRRILPVIMTMTVVVLSLVTVFAMSSILNIPIRTSTMVYPPIILAAGVCDAIHLFTIFFQQLKKGKNKKNALIYTMRHSGLAMLFTSLTTMGGFLAFGFSDLAGIVELGICAAIGVIMALVFTYLLIPALLSLLPIILPKKANNKKTGINIWEKTIKQISMFSAKKPVLILIITLVISAAAIIGTTQIDMSFDVLSWFPKKEKVRNDTYKADNIFKGGTVLEVVIDTGKENGIFEPEVINAIEKACIYAKSLDNEKILVGKTISIVDIIKQINKVLNEDKQEFYSIPQDRKMIAQEIFLFEMNGSEDLEDLVDNKYSQARLTLRVPSVDGADFAPFRKTIKTEFTKIFDGKANVYLTGSVDLFVRSVWGLMNSMTTSYILAAIVITLFLLLLTGSLRIGLVGMIPNFFPILVVMGVMGFTGIPISLFTVLLGSIALGLAVDDTVHFLYNFKRNFDKTQNIMESVSETMNGTGKALFYTTLSLSIGFTAFLFSDLNALRQFGFLTGLTVILALLSDLTITPALMALLFRKKEQKANLTIKQSQVIEKN